MTRLFAALELAPELIAATDTARGSVEGAHWQRDDQLHLTLGFLGDISEKLAREVMDALACIHFKPFDLRLSGVGAFGKEGQPRVLWAGVEHPQPIIRLHEKIARAVGTAGVDIDKRRFTPHVTLARFPRRAHARVSDWMSRNQNLASPVQLINGFTLFSSHRTDEGRYYRPEASFGGVGEIMAWQEEAALEGGTYYPSGSQSHRQAQTVYPLAYPTADDWLSGAATAPSPGGG